MYALMGVKSGITGSAMNSNTINFVGGLAQL